MLTGLRRNSSELEAVLVDWETDFAHELDGPGAQRPIGIDPVDEEHDLDEPEAPSHALALDREIAHVRRWDVHRESLVGLRDLQRPLQELHREICSPRRAGGWAVMRITRTGGSVRQ